MEEKKTKKMTKAEAFEWLKCKKVRVSCREISEKVQSKLFACGVQWKNGGTDFRDYGNYYVINLQGLLGHCDGMGPYWECLINEEITADDILSIEIVEEKKEEEENINNDLDKWIEIVRNKYCRHGWSFVISKSNYGLIRGDLIEEKSKR